MKSYPHYYATELQAKQQGEIDAINNLYAKKKQEMTRLYNERERDLWNTASEGESTDWPDVFAWIGLVLGCFTCWAAKGSIGFLKSLGVLILTWVGTILLGYLVKFISKASSNSIKQKRIPELQDEQAASLDQLDKDCKNELSILEKKYEKIRDSYILKFNNTARDRYAKIWNDEEGKYSSEAVLRLRCSEIAQDICQKMKSQIEAEWKKTKDYHSTVCVSLFCNIHPNAIIVAGCTYEFQNYGLLPRNDDSDLYALAGLFGTLIVQELQRQDWLPDKRERDKRVSHTEECLFNSSELLENWRQNILDPSYDIENTAYIRLAISYKAQNDRYQPPV